MTRAVRLLLLGALLLCGLASFHFTASGPKDAAVAAAAHGHADAADVMSARPQNPLSGAASGLGGSDRPAEEDCLAFATMAAQHTGLLAGTATAREMTVLDALDPPAAISAPARTTSSSVGLRLAALAVSRT